MRAYSQGFVRVRIIKQSTGIVDGWSLASLIPGSTYDLPDSLAEYLIANRCAEHAMSERATAIVPDDDDRAIVDRLVKGIRVEQTEAADKPRRTRKKHSKPL